MRRLHLSIAFLCLASWLSAQTDSTLFMKQLCALDCVSEVQPLETTCFKEKYVLKMEQQVDWKTSAKGTFGERIFVGMKGLDKPTVIVTEGYSASYGLNPGYEEELSRLFDANVVLCEYRYFSQSVPVPTNWDYMTVDNSLADYHHVRQVFGQLSKVTDLLCLLCIAKHQFRSYGTACKNSFILRKILYGLREIAAYFHC